MCVNALQNVDGLDLCVDPRDRHRVVALELLDHEIGRAARAHLRQRGFVLACERALLERERDRLSRGLGARGEVLRGRREPALEARDLLRRPAVGDEPRDLRFVRVSSLLLQRGVQPGGNEASERSIAGGRSAAVRLSMQDAERTHAASKVSVSSCC